MKEEIRPDTLTERTSNLFVAYTVLTTAAEMLLRELDTSMAIDHINFKRENRKALRSLQQSIARTKYCYQVLCELMTEGAEDFDALLNDSNTAVVLLMRYYNATHDNIENGDKIREFMKGLQVKDLFPEQQIQKFESRL